MRRGWGPAPARVKGQPLVAMGMILIGWIAFRASVIELPGADHMRRETPAGHAIAAQAAAPAPKHAAMPRPGDVADRGHVFAAPAPAPLPERPVRWGDTGADRIAAGQTMLWMAAMSDLSIPAELAPFVRSVRGDGSRASGGNRAAADLSAAVPGPGAKSPGGPARWSVDGWLVLREGSVAGPAAGGLQPPVYGLSQLGAVLRYRLAPGSDHRPAAYLRASQGLVRQGESELAAGLAVRPVAALPVTAHVEARLTHRVSGTEIRPAAFVSTGIDHASLPLGFAARGYLQAGYVGGAFATGFADGSLVAERRLAQARDMRLSAGAGSWGGIQKGAKRLDLGPSASVTMALGAVPARVELDYRLRVLGDAEPSHGAALTLSTGF